MQIMGFTMDTIHHPAENGLIQTFTSFEVKYAPTGGKFYKYHSSDWLLVENGALYVNEEEDGDCLVDWSADYDDETLTLAPLKKIIHCIESPYAEDVTALIKYTKELIKEHLGVNVDHLPPYNLLMPEG